eukprot:2152346-Rhodomonas_salina.2
MPVRRREIDLLERCEHVISRRVACPVHSLSTAQPIVPDFVSTTHPIAPYASSVPNSLPINSSSTSSGVADRAKSAPDTVIAAA